MAQRFSCLAEGIDPRTISPITSRQAAVIALGGWANREKPAIRAPFQIRSASSIASGTPRQFLGPGQQLFLPRAIFANAVGPSEHHPRSYLETGAADILDDTGALLAEN